MTATAEARHLQDQREVNSFEAIMERRRRSYDTVYNFLNSSHKVYKPDNAVNTAVRPHLSPVVGYTTLMFGDKDWEIMLEERKDGFSIADTKSSLGITITQFPADHPRFPLGLCIQSFDTKHPQITDERLPFSVLHTEYALLPSGKIVFGENVGVSRRGSTETEIQRTFYAVAQAIRNDQAFELTREQAQRIPA